MATLITGHRVMQTWQKMSNGYFPVYEIRFDTMTFLPLIAVCHFKSHDDLCIYFRYNCKSQLTNKNKFKCCPSKKPNSSSINYTHNMTFCNETSLFMFGLTENKTYCDIYYNKKEKYNFSLTNDLTK